MVWFLGFWGWWICCVGCGCYTIDSRGLGCYGPVFEFGFSAWGGGGLGGCLRVLLGLRSLAYWVLPDSGDWFVAYWVLVVW